MHSVIVALSELSQSVQWYNGSLQILPSSRRFEELRGNTYLRLWRHAMTEYLHISQENKWSDAYVAFCDKHFIMAFLH